MRVAQSATDPFLTVSFDTPHEICGWARDQGQKKHRGEATPPPPDKCPPLPKNYADPDPLPEALKRERISNKPAHADSNKFTDDDWRQYRWAYQHYTRTMDDHVGRMMEALKETGHADNTLVIFVADHGDGNASHRWNQKSALWEEVVRVPLIFWQPGVVKASRADAGLVATGLDLLPTLCDFAGAKMPEGYLGVSLKPNCTGERGESPHEYVVTETDIGRGRGRCVRTKRCKYIVYEGDNGQQFFDIEQDPGEMKNRIADRAVAEEIGRHRGLLRQWCQQTGDTFVVPGGE